MYQYLNNGKRLLEEGKDVYNERTGKSCKTLITVDFNYDVSEGKLPIGTLRQSYYKAAIGELIAYIRGYDKLADFHKLGVRTWDANVASDAWDKEKKDSIGWCYGALANRMGKATLSDDETWAIVPLDSKIENNQLYQICLKLLDRQDDRRLIMSFWHPAFHHLGCLAPCMYEYQFSLVEDTLHLNVNQRSCDYPLGGNFNIMQSWFMLWVVAKVTNLKPGIVNHRMVNTHIYEDQVDLFKEEMSREPYPLPHFQHIGDEPITLERLFEIGDVNGLHPKEFTLVNYIHHEPIKYPFTA